MLRQAKAIHKRDWSQNPTPNNDHEQSWRAFKGKNLEKLIQFIITDEVENLGLKVVNGNSLERSRNLSKELSSVKRNLAIDYGKYGLHLPDIDIIIYDPNTYNVLVVISSKVTLRERIAQTGYWKFKLSQDEATKHIKVYFITPDEDGTLTTLFPAKKGRAIVEVDLDGSYVLTEEKIEESQKVIGFDISPYRNDIIQADARELPLRDGIADFVFIDSPYSDNLKYNDHPNNIGNISCVNPEFFEELEKVSKETFRILKPKKYMAWLIGDHWRKKSGFIPVGLKLYYILERYFTPIDIICVARRNQTSNTSIWHKKAQEYNFYLRGFKFLIIMQK